MRNRTNAARRQRERGQLHILPCTPIADALVFLTEHRAELSELTLVARCKSGGVHVLTTGRNRHEILGQLTELQHEFITWPLDTFEEGDPDMPPSA